MLSKIKPDSSEFIMRITGSHRRFSGQKIKGVFLIINTKSSPKELIPICRNENTPCTTAPRGRVALPEDIDNLYRFHGRARRPCRAVSIQG